MKRVSQGIIGALSLASVVFTASTGRADEAVVVEPEYAGPEDAVAYVKRTPNADLIIGGIFLFGSAYAFSAVAAGTSEVPSDRHLWVPVAGPWLDLANRPACGAGAQRPGCQNEPVNKAMLVASGLMQGVGALQMVGGLLFPKTEVVMVRQGVRVVPTATGSSVGVSAIGRF